jgi:hypothetical protein
MPSDSGFEEVSDEVAVRVRCPLSAVLGPGARRSAFGVAASHLKPMQPLIACATAFVFSASTVIVGQLVNASYPILLVPAADSKVPPPTGGVALATGRDLPSNLVAPQVLEPLLSRTWKQSRTFRRQCARIDAEPGLRVRVFTAATVSQSGGRAATDIQRGATGLEAVVYIARRAAASDLIELIAHEFEHIIEQLDGLDLARLARLAPVTVWATDGQRFETERATHTGRLVAAEVEGRAR